MVKSWTPSEVAPLRELYADRSVTTDRLVATFARSLDSIQAKARRLGIGRKKWSSEEDELLRRQYQDVDVDRRELAVTLGRSVGAVRSK